MDLLSSETPSLVKNHLKTNIYSIHFIRKEKRVHDTWACFWDRRVLCWFFCHMNSKNEIHRREGWEQSNRKQSSHSGRLPPEGIGNGCMLSRGWHDKVRGELGDLEDHRLEILEIVGVSVQSHQGTCCPCNSFPIRVLIMSCFASGTGSGLWCIPSRSNGVTGHELSTLFINSWGGVPQPCPPNTFLSPALDSFCINSQLTKIGDPWWEQWVGWRFASST